MLNDCRVLDLTDEKGFLCGKILADLGADVIKIEKSGGQDSGRMGPFWKDSPDPEKSLYWYAYNSNKRGVTLDIDKDAGIGLKIATGVSMQDLNGRLLLAKSATGTRAQIRFPL